MLDDYNFISPCLCEKVKGDKFCCYLLGAKFSRKTEKSNSCCFLCFFDSDTWIPDFIGCFPLIGCNDLARFRKDYVCCSPLCYNSPQYTCSPCFCRYQNTEVVPLLCCSEAKDKGKKSFEILWLVSPVLCFNRQRCVSPVWCWCVQTKKEAVFKSKSSKPNLAYMYNEKLITQPYQRRIHTLGWARWKKTGPPIQSMEADQRYEAFQRKVVSIADKLQVARENFDKDTKELELEYKDLLKNGSEAGYEALNLKVALLFEG